MRSARLARRRARGTGFAQGLLPKQFRPRQGTRTYLHRVSLYQHGCLWIPLRGGNTDRPQGNENDFRKGNFPRAGNLCLLSA